jgi:uncharacterized protein (TIGR03437 family)
MTNTQCRRTNGKPADLVFGQSRFDSSNAAGGAAGLRAPTDVAVDSSGNILVADTGNNRVVMYSSLLFAQTAGTAALAVIGQRDLNAVAPDWDSPDGLATADSLFDPRGIYLDRNDTVYVADAGNSRVVQFLKAVSIVNAAHLQPSVPVGQGSIAALKSSGICDHAQSTDPAQPLPFTLAGRQVVVNDSVVAPLYGASTSDIHFQVPLATPVGTNRIAVRNADSGELLAGGAFSVVAVAPGLFTVSQTGGGQGMVGNQDGSVNSASNAATKGSTISLYGTGQGPVSPPVPDGMLAPTDQQSYTVTVPASDAKTCLSSQQAMCVVFSNSGIGGLQFSGLAPGQIGCGRSTSLSHRIRLREVLCP